MKIFINVRNNHNQWGGDIAVINALHDGLQRIGIPAETHPDISKANSFDHTIITNSCTDLRKTAEYLIENRIAYSVLPFHEDFLLYYPTCIGFYKLVDGMLNQKKLEGVSIDLKMIYDNPYLSNYLGPQPLPTGFINANVFKQAHAVLPTSEFEAKTVTRDSPNAKINVCQCPNIISNKFTGKSNDSFLKLTNINEGYILQVGRLETRKNQLASILACYDIPKTLVFIATKGYQPQYTKSVITAIKQVRKYPTIIVSEEIPSIQDGMLKVIAMPDGKKLDYSILESAYQHAAVNCHPAFYELPGLTYLESMYCKIPTIVSEWTSAQEFISGIEGQDYWMVKPFDLKSIRKAVIAALYKNNELPFTGKVTWQSIDEYAKSVISSVLSSY